MDSGTGTRALPRVGFPIRRSRDQRLVSTSPTLIAAAHVLLRLLAPRHPPCALVLLIEKNTCIPLWSFQGARGHASAIREEPGCLSRQWPVSQNSTAKRPSTLIVEVDVDLGEPDHGRPVLANSVPSTSLAAPQRSSASEIPRKEVIQPQLPLRLPCYDFTPIINPTFDGSLPYGLGHRLRVLPTLVV